MQQLASTSQLACPACETKWSCAAGRPPPSRTGHHHASQGFRRPADATHHAPPRQQPLPCTLTYRCSFPFRAQQTLRPRWRSAAATGCRAASPRTAAGRRGPPAPRWVGQWSSVGRCACHVRVVCSGGLGSQEHMGAVTLQSAQCSAAASGSRSAISARGCAPCSRLCSRRRPQRASHAAGLAPCIQRDLEYRQTRRSSSHQGSSRRPQPQHASGRRGRYRRRRRLRRRQQRVASGMHRLRRAKIMLVNVCDR